MNILINCSNIKIGGGIQVAHSFLNEIKGETSNMYVVVLSSTLERQIQPSEFGPNFIFYVYDKVASPISAVFSKDKLLDAWVKNHSISKVFTVFGPSYWRPQVVHICGYAKPHYIYTSSPFFKVISNFENFKLKAKGFFHLLDFKKNADLLITENPDVSAKIGRKLGKKVFTVSNTYNQVFDNKEQWSDIQLPTFNGKYLLTISANYPHKNLNVIPLVAKELVRQKCKKFKFAVSLDKGQLNSDDAADELIVYLGKVEINDCPALYNQVSYMFLPTLLECFSASYAEAMRMQKPILTSDLDFARGLCQEAAAYFDPLNPEAIAALLIALDKDEGWQKQITDNGINRLKDFDNAPERAKKYLQIISTS